MTDSPPAGPTPTRRLTARRELVLGAGLFTLGGVVWAALESRTAGACVGLPLLLVGLGLCLSAGTGRAAGPAAAPGAGELASLRQVAEAHATELAGRPTPAETRRALTIWRAQMHGREPEYAGLVAGDARRPDADRAETGAVLEAYLAGYLAGRGWVAERQALAHAGLLGRRLRDDLRSSGLALDTLPASVGMEIDQALAEVVHHGMGGGRADARPASPTGG